MDNNVITWQTRLKAMLLDWLIWAYLPVAVLYFFHTELKDLSYLAWLYAGAVLFGLILAIVLEATGVSIGKRLFGIVAEEPVEERGTTARAPWYKTQIGITAVLLAVITFVLGWRITEINLYYVFTRADKMTNMTDRLLRPYWPVIGTLFEKMIETIFLALMSTVLAIPLAIIVSFLAARNLMYRITTKWETALSSFVLAVAGASLGLWLVDLLVAPLESSIFDIKLISGILAPVLSLAGLLGFGYLGSKLTKHLNGRRNSAPAQALIRVLGVALGVGVAYTFASLVAMIVFAGSWRIFVRDYGIWAYVVLALGAIGGLVLGWRRTPSDEFPIGKLAYGVVRSILNATRSIEPFVWALIFVTWFRLGPFPGTVALMVHSVAALGKLYSEQIESIDPGPLEAVRATGANELQTVVFAVIPQIIPPYISFTIYRWDINVRMSTIIGLVGGGGIGQMLFQYQNLGQWRKTSVAVIMIVAVVMTLDNISARIRERII